MLYREIVAVVDVVVIPANIDFRIYLFMYLRMFFMYVLNFG